MTRVRLSDGRILTLDEDARYVRRHLLGWSGDIVRAGKPIDQFEIVEVLDEEAT